MAGARPPYWAFTIEVLVQWLIRSRPPYLRLGRGLEWRRGRATGGAATLTSKANKPPGRRRYGLRTHSPRL